MHKVWSGLLLVSLSSGCAPSVKEHLQAATNQRLQQISASDRRVGPPASFDFLPWAPGQWAAYRTISGKEKQPSFVRVQVLEQTEEGIWLETESLSYYDRSVSKVLYARMPTTSDEALDLVQKIVVEADGEGPQEVDFTQDSPFVRLMKGTMKHHVGWGQISSQVDFQGTREVRVPAGTFAGCGSYDATVTVLGVSSSSTALVHPAVPLGGMVQSTSKDGAHVTELLDYGF
jgi:hypothetical protein